jgi:hypothetical protein
MDLRISKDTYIRMEPVGRPFGGASRDYGLRLTTSWGSTGTQYKDPRRNMFCQVNLTFIAWTVKATCSWKGKPET